MVAPRGIDPKRSRGLTTLRQALEKYLTTNKRLRPVSIRDYRFSIERHLTKWLDLPLSEINW